MHRLPEYPQRQRLRLAGYDYASAGYYFVTVCTHGRTCLFGSVVEGKMDLNAAGQMVRTVWEEMPTQYPGVGIDELVVMPNHLHGIVVLTGDSDTEEGRADTGGSAPTRALSVSETGHGGNGGSAVGPGGAGALSLIEVMQRFKSLTVMRYGIGVRQEGWPAYVGKLWQRSYHERVIRNERELDAVRLYMVGNPKQWALDRENPEYSER